VKWKDVATTDPGQIEAWRRRWPGCAWGWKLPVGSVVVDVDDQAAFDATGLLLPHTAWQGTVSGGTHWLYEGLDVRQTVKVVPGIDTRVGGKGWVGLYADDAFAGPVALAPEWLLDLGPVATAVASEPGPPLRTRSEIVSMLGHLRRAGLDEPALLAALLSQYGTGRITESDPSRPWTKADFIVLAREAAKWTAGDPTFVPVAMPVRVRGAVAPPPLPDPPTHTVGKDLLAMTLEPLQWAIPTILPEGTTLIVSPPKVGKSALVVQFAVAILTGGSVLDCRAAFPRPVLYLALEDGPRRMKDRLLVNLKGRTPAEVETMANLDIRFEAPTLKHGLEEMLTDWYDLHPTGVVFVDTLQHVRPEAKAGRGVYAGDVADLRALRDIVRFRPGTVLGVVHHTNKPNASDDFVQSVSGSYGVAGTADTILRVVRKRHEERGKLEGSGRDVPELDLDVVFEDLLWTLDPNPLPKKGAGKMTPANQEIWNWLQEHGPAFPAEVATSMASITGWRSRDATDKMMTTMEGHGWLKKSADKGYEVDIPSVTVHE
jgi:hypothetical protein